MQVKYISVSLEVVRNNSIYNLEYFWIVWFKHFVLIFLGRATAIGLQIDIPILIRSLADRILSDNNDFLTYVLSSNLSMILDMDREENNISSFNWWDHNTVRLISYLPNT
jgi:hypothetical protein